LASTHQGITGRGEAHAVTIPRGAQVIVSDLFKPILLGQDARNIEMIRDYTSSNRPSARR
jgi:L-alanine-DL-glutamate epimerase-like enolase superfamily enzyme